MGIWRGESPGANRLVLQLAKRIQEACWTPGDFSRQRREGLPRFFRVFMSKSTSFRVACACDSRALVLSATLLVLLTALAFPARAQTGWPVVVSDAFRRSVTIESEPKRIISLSPSNTEILFAIGAGDRVVGVTTFCNFPPEAATRARVGGFAGSTVNLEMVIALRPDLVVAGDEHHRAVIDALSRKAIPAISIKAGNISEVYDSIRLIGRATGGLREAEELVKSMQARVNAVASRAAAIRPVDRVRVYWEVFDAPLITSGRNSFIGQLIEMAGGVNVFADIDAEFPQVNTESVIARDPQVILGPEVPGVDELSLEKVRARKGWGGIDAVRNGRVYALSGDLTSRPGPRLVDGLELVARTLYPRLFPAAATP